MTDQDRDDADEWEDISGDSLCLILCSLKPDAPLPPQLRVIVRHLGRMGSNRYCELDFLFS